MGFQQGLSGLNAASKSLDVIGNNVANANTVGFKGSRTEFADIFANSLASSATQSGIGTRVSAVTQQFSQGNITATSNPLDIAITGGGFFRMTDKAGSISYSRNGQFQIDKDGFVVNNNQNLTGYPVTDTGTILAGGTPVPLRIQTSNIGARATGASGTADAGLNFKLNLNAGDKIISRGSAGVSLTGLTLEVAPAVGTTHLLPAVTVNDSQNNPHPLEIRLSARAGSTGVWDVDYRINEGAPPPAFSRAPVPLTFNNAGTMIGGSPVAVSAIPPGSSAVVNLSLNFASNTQTGGAFVAPTNTVVASTGLRTTDPATFNSSTSATVYDAQGVAHSLSFYFTKTAVNLWEVQTSFDGQPPSLIGSPLTFDGNGKLTSGSPIVFSTNLIAPNGATSPFGFSVFLEGSSQFGSPFGVFSLRQDGYGDGVLTGLTLSKDGIMQGRYSNGQNRTIGQIVLSNFPNTQGLQPLGDNRWAETFASGQVRTGAPGTTDLGTLQSAAVEDSNIDMTAELVNMITAQRSYQANAQTIKTQDQILQTLVNLR